MILRLSLLALCLLPATGATSDLHDGTDNATHAHYLANAGVMIERGDTKIMFDPFFRNGFNVYDLMPAKMEEDILAGTAPWNGIDAIFISHHHGDHFDPAIVLKFLTLWPTVHLYAPEQAITALAILDGADETGLRNRLHNLTLARDGDPVHFVLGELNIEAVRIAHAGWPERHSDVENIVFRVTIDDATTVIHLGDADSGEEHYVPHEAFWATREADLALPPVWLMLTEKGRHVLDKYVNANYEIGVHVFNSIPDEILERDEQYRGIDIFTRPGETRQLQD